MPIRRHPILSSRADTECRHLEVDGALIRRLKSSYRLIRKKEDTLAELFYRRFFAAAPEVRAMFRVEVSSQASKLMAALDAVVTHLENPATTESVLADLGRKHAAYGVKREHYAMVVELLTDAIREVLGADADDRVVGDWSVTLRAISEHMMSVAEPDRNSKRFPPCGD